MVFTRKIKRGKYTYLAEVENKWENGKVVQKHLRYVGKEINGEKILSGSLANAEVDKVTIWAPLLVLNTLAKQIKLSSLLGEDGDYLLSLAYAHCLDPKSIASMEDWYERTDLRNMLSIKEVSEKKLYDALDAMQERNTEQVQKNIFTQVKEAYNLKPKGYFFDVTNVYFYGTECGIAKKGHNKEGSYNPQIQIGLAITEEGIPLFHKTFEGNIHDARTLQDILVSLHDLNIKEAFLIWDKGVTSEKNLLDAKRIGFNLICGLPIKKDVEKKVQQMIKKNKFIQLKNRIRLKNTVLYCIKQKYAYGTIRGQLALCFNEETARINREKRIDRLEEAKENLKAKKEIPEDLKQYFNNNEISEKDLLEAQQYDGYTALFSTKQLPIEKIVNPYFEKDKVEKAFRSMKSILGLKPIRHWLEERVKSHVFICYLSYLLLSLLEYKLKKMEISPTEALEKLSTAYKVRLRDPKTKNEFEKTVTLTKEQEKIMKKVDKNILKNKS